MKRTEFLQEAREIRFEEAYEGCKSGCLTQAKAALLLGVCDNTFRCYMGKYDEGGLDALMDKQLTQGRVTKGAGRHHRYNGSKPVSE